MNSLKKRGELRAFLSGEQCYFPASVYDPISARIAQDIGYELAMFAGSLASFTVLGAPDKMVLTLTELAEQARRICRASSIPLIVDADHGFGNALNVRRTVEELETAGVAGLTIEDTELPQGFGKSPKSLISVEETIGKFQAALDARQDASLCIFSRTTAFNVVSQEEALARIERYLCLPVDGLFLVGIKSWQQLEAVRRLTSLPILLGSFPENMKDTKLLASLSVRIALEGHSTFAVACKAIYENMIKLRSRIDPSVEMRSVPEELVATITQEALYQQWIQKYLQVH
jgi:carboxyvinyl-carboxyphosphonate phosphorylmutase